MLSGVLIVVDVADAGGAIVESAGLAGVEAAAVVF